MKLFLTLVEMNSKEFLRDPVAAFFTVAFPLVFAFIFGFTSAHKATTNFVFAVADQRNTADSRRIAETLAARPGVRVRAVAESAGRSQVEGGQAAALLILGPASSRLVASKAQRPWAQNILDAAAAEMAAAPGAPVSRIYTVEPESARQQTDFTFLFPGLLAMALLQLGLFATANPLLRARDRGTLRHISTTPVPRGQLLAAQITVRFLVAAFEMGLLLGVGQALFRVEIAGSVLALIAAYTAGAVMLISLGYAIAGLAPTEAVGSIVLLLLNFAMLAFGQIFVDFSGVAGLSQVVKLMPATYLADGCRQALLGVKGMFSLQFDLLMMSLWAAVCIVVAIRTFRSDMGTR